MATPQPVDDLTAGREALEAGAWQDALHAFQRLLASEETPEALEGLGLAAWWLNLGAVVAGVLLHAELLRTNRWSRHCLWWWPFSAPILLFILWRAVILTLRRGGIDWRGTLYSLDELKRAHKP